MVKFRYSVLVAVLVGTVASCGGAVSPPASSPSLNRVGLIAPIHTPTAAGRFGTKPPIITVGIGAPPAVLEASDLITGTGRSVKKGDIVTVQYEEVNYAAPETVVNGTWGQMPFSFTVGGSQVIKGWSKGILGMKVGGRRELIVPPNLAYVGVSDATVVLVVDLLRIAVST